MKGLLLTEEERWARRVARMYRALNVLWCALLVVFSHQVAAVPWTGLSAAMWCSAWFVVGLELRGRQKHRADLLQIERDHYRRMMHYADDDARFWREAACKRFEPVGDVVEVDPAAEVTS